MINFRHRYMEMKTPPYRLSRSRIKLDGRRVRGRYHKDRGKMKKKRRVFLMMKIWVTIKMHKVSTIMLWEDGKGRNRVKKSNLFSIQNKVIQKKVVPKHIESKFKKTSGNQQSNPIATFLYKPGVLLPCLSPYINCMIAIRIAREYIQKSNPAIINR